MKRVKLLVLTLLALLIVVAGAPVQSHADEWGTDLVLNEYTFKKEWLNTMLPLNRKYKILPSLNIAQTFKETNWGQAPTINYFDKDHNMSGITWPGTGNPDITFSKGVARPQAEGGNYVHYDSVGDYLKDYLYLLRPGNNYNVSGVSDFQQAASGFFKVGGAKYDYAASGPEGYVDDLISLRKLINEKNDNALDKLDKLVLDGGTWKETNGVTQEDLENAETPSETTLDPTISHTFQVNGFGTELGKDWDEVALETPTAAEAAGAMTTKQKQVLQDWIDEYNNATIFSVVGIIRVLIQTFAILLILFSLLLIVAYSFDRVGVLDFSLLALVTGGKIATAYEKEDQSFFGKKNQSSGGPKYITFGGLSLLIILSLLLGYLTFSGRIFIVIQSIYAGIETILDTLPKF